jgi:AcrR family transcriptional regulator
LHAAREVFSELGYDAATFQAIAIRADLTRPAINHYFGSKSVLYREVVEQTNAAVIAAGIAKANESSTLLGRLSAFFAAAMDAGSADRSTAAFLVTSVLEAQRHPDLVSDEHDALKSSRAFVSWAVNDAVERGELSVDTDIPAIVEMLIAVMWGMGFYAGYVGNADELGVIVDKFELLMANKLWQLRD